VYRSCYQGNLICHNILSNNVNSQCLDSAKSEEELIRYYEIKKIQIFACICIISLSDST
jgi:hypothetical protein